MDPQMLSDEHKRQRVEISKILLHRCQQEGDETVDVWPGGDHRARNKLLEHLITGDETLLHLSTPETTRLNDMEAPALSCQKKVQSPAISNKSDGHRVLVLTWNDPFRYSAKRRSVNADRYCETLDRLRHAVRRKRPGLLRSGVFLQHDNATPYTAKRTKEWLERC
ncbi:histone-lysine N-methyltransferase SETMAR, partial [Plakobranchus ocellatus]